MSENPVSAPEGTLLDRVGEADPFGGPHHTGLMVEHLRRTRPWILFFTVLGFIVAGLMFIVALITSLALALQATGEDTTGRLAFVFVGVGIYGGTGFFFVIFTFLLLRYARAIGRLVVSNATEDIELAIDAQRQIFRSTGIVTIVLFGLVVVVIGVLIYTLLTMPRHL